VIALSITRRFVLLLGLGILVLFVSAALRISLTVFIVYNLACIAMLLIDYFLSEEEEKILIDRIGEENLSIYEGEAISFQVYNKSGRPLYFELKDEVPDVHFKTENKIMKGTVPAHEKKIFQYTVTPTKRGAFMFGSLHGRYEGRLKLCMRMFKLDLRRDYKIYPNMKNLRKYRLSLINNRSLRQGEKRMKMLGKGTSFESLREYIPGDEYRKINWKATARGNKPIVNQYEPEKNQHVHIFIDTGRPMSHTVRGYRKLDLVVNTALVLSDIVNQNGDKSGLLLFNTEVSNMIMPGKGAGHRNKILEALYHIDYNNQTSNYDDAFYYFKRKERHRSIVFLFTDFDTLEEAENILKVMPAISRNHLVVLMLIKNESLEKLGEEVANNDEAIFNKGVALELLEERHKIISLLNRRGIFCIECPAEKLEHTAVNKYIEVKNRTYM
jgi:uncharacterized protein (DUF58 family)